MNDFKAPKRVSEGQLKELVDIARDKRNPHSGEAARRLSLFVYDERTPPYMGVDEHRKVLVENPEVTEERRVGTLLRSRFPEALTIEVALPRWINQRHPKYPKGYTTIAHLAVARADDEGALAIFLNFPELLPLLRQERDSKFSGVLRYSLLADLAVRSSVHDEILDSRRVFLKANVWEGKEYLPLVEHMIDTMVWYVGTLSDEREYNISSASDELRRIIAADQSSAPIVERQIAEALEKYHEIDEAVLRLNAVREALRV